MGLIAWIILLVLAAALATAAQYLFFRQARRPTDYDWVSIAGGALLGGFTAHVWYPGWGPGVDGLNVLPALLGAVAVGAAADLVYRLVLRPRHLA